MNCMSIDAATPSWPPLFLALPPNTVGKKHRLEKWRGKYWRIPIKKKSDGGEIPQTKEALMASCYHSLTPLMPRRRKGRPPYSCRAHTSRLFDKAIIYKLWLYLVFYYIFLHTFCSASHGEYRALRARQISPSVIVAESVSSLNGASRPRLRTLEGKELSFLFLSFNKTESTIFQDPLIIIYRNLV